jgi:hypothetical protein
MLKLGLPLLGIVLFVGACSPVNNEDLFADYPHEGDGTSYGVPLSTKNAARFIEYYQQYQLTPEQEAVKKEALSSMVAPCCDDNPMYTCCCPCNLAKTVWGLSAYLIAEKNFDSAAVKDAALQWLHFIRPDYYKAQELKQQGLDPHAYGLSDEDSCYVGKCEWPFSKGGCGGMTTLRLE